MSTKEKLEFACDVCGHTTAIDGCLESAAKLPYQWQRVNGEDLCGTCAESLVEWRRERRDERIRSNTVLAEKGL